MPCKLALHAATQKTFNPQASVGAGFKPALRRKIDLIRPGNAMGGFVPHPKGSSFGGAGISVGQNPPLRNRASSLRLWCFSR